MCAPAAIGVATAAVGAGQAVAGHSAGQQQAAAQNQSIANNYKRQLKLREANWRRDRTLYNTKVIDYKRQLQNNDKAANDAFVSEQTRLNNIYRQFAFQQEAGAVKLQEQSGKLTASGRSGKSIQRAEMMATSLYGRSLQRGYESLASARNAMKIRTSRITDELANANERAYTNVRFAPEPDLAPATPTFVQGPSSLSLIAGLGGAALDGVSAGMKSKSWFE